MRLKLIIGFLLVILFLGGSLPVNAASCRQIDNHQVCLIKIERSAKYYWQYRVVLSVDGQKKPMKVYSCRDDLITDPENNITILPNPKIQAWICSLFN